MLDLGTGPSEQWCYYIIVRSQPSYDLLDQGSQTRGPRAACDP